MLVSLAIFFVSMGFLFFYLQAICEKVLRRQFSPNYSGAIVVSNRLEFPMVRKAVQDFDAHVEIWRFAPNLRCDFLVLTYLLKYANNVYQRFTYEERLLMVYFGILFASLRPCRLFRWHEKSIIWKLTVILEYFANVVGERFNQVRLGNIPESALLNA
jgi:hypothetical protein